MMPSTITPHLLQLRAPSAIADLPGWLCWRFEQPPGGGKPRKVPYYASGRKRHGVQGRPEDREQLVTFEAAKAAAARRGFDGVGFAPMPEWRITALDFDACVANGRVDPLVEDLVATTYAEFSPSGNGVRAFVTGALGNRKALAGEQFGFETFSSKGFVTFTGNPLPVCQQFDTLDTLAPVSDALRALCDQRFAGPAEERPAAEPLGVRRELLEEALDVLPVDLTYDQWLQVGMALHHELGPDGFEVWDAWSSRSPKYGGVDYGQERWASFGRYDGPSVTVRSLVRMANEHGARISLSAALDAAAFDDLTVADAPAEGEPAKPLRFPVLPVGTFLQAPRQRYLVKGLIPQAPLVVLYGESGAGKTFAVLDLVMSVVRGTAWRNHKVVQSRVVYIAAEGAGGLRNRIQAYCEFHGLDMGQLDLGVIADAPNLLLAPDARDLILSIRAAGGAGLVVVDTFAQVTPGANENAGEDVGRALAHCREIHRHTGATVLLVHHSGKDASRGARGWSGLRAAADAELEVTRDNDDRTIRLSKSKDGEDGLLFGFRLNVVSIGEDEDGDPVTSCVVEATEAVQSAGKGKKQGDVQRLVMRVLSDLLALSGDTDAHHDDLVGAVVAQLPHEDGKRDQRPMRVKRAIALLEGDGSLVIFNQRVSLS